MEKILFGGKRLSCSICGCNDWIKYYASMVYIEDIDLVGKKIQVLECYSCKQILWFNKNDLAN